MNSRRILVRHPEGMSLLEVMFAMGGIAGLAMAVVSLLDIQQRGIKGNRLLANRDTIRSTLDRYMTNPDIVARSALYRNSGTEDAGNILIDQCLRGQSAAAPLTAACAADKNQCCPANTGATPWTTFQFLDPASKNSPILMAGTQTAPARYNTEGALCTAVGPSSDCIIEVVTQFSATCANGATACEKSESISLNYEIRQAQGFSLKGAPPLRPQSYSPQGTYVDLAALSKSIQKLVAGGAPSGMPSGTPSSTPANGSVTEIVPSLFRETFTASGTFTVPEGVKEVYVTLVAGGGGGGNANSSSGAGGASSCARLRNRVIVQPGANIPITVGKGGAPTGGGQASSFGGTLTMTGGNPGQSGYVSGSGGSTKIYGGVVNCPASSSANQALASGVLESTIISGNSGGGYPSGSNHGGAAPISNIGGTNNYGAGGKGAFGGSIKYGDPGQDGVVLVEYVK